MQVKLILIKSINTSDLSSSLNVDQITMSVWYHWSLLMVNDKAIQRKSQTLSEGHGHLTEITETHRKGTCSIKEDCNVLFFNSSKFSLMT